MADQPMIINDRDNDNGFGGGLGTGLIGLYTTNKNQK